MKTNTFKLVFFNLYFLSIGIAFSQSYDQLKTQLQFENYYSTRLKQNDQDVKISGSQHLVNDWLPIEVSLPSGNVIFDEGRLNLTHSCLEVKYNGQEMYISSQNFLRVKLLNRIFVPGSKYYYNDIALLGLIEIYSQDPKPPYVMQQHFTYLKEPNSNGYVSGGSTSKSLVKSSKIFIHNGTSLIKVNGKSTLEKIYKGRANDFSKNRKLLKTDFKNASSIQVLIDKMESI